MLANKVAPSTRISVGNKGVCARPSAHARLQRTPLQVTNALTRQKKEAVVAEVRERLEKSVIVFSLRHKGLDVPKFQQFRRGLPENASVMVCKNTLMRIACEGNPLWTQVAERCEGDNAWVFVDEDGIQDAVKHYFKYEDALFTQAKRSAAKGQEVKPPTSLNCIVMDDRLLTPAEFKACENIPTKTQLITTVAVLAKQPATKIATGVKQVPSKLAIALKQVSEKDDDKSKTVGEFVA